MKNQSPWNKTNNSLNEGDSACRQFLAQLCHAAASPLHTAQAAPLSLSLSPGQYWYFAVSFSAILALILTSHKAPQHKAISFRSRKTSRVRQAPGHTRGTWKQFRGQSKGKETNIWKKYYLQSGYSSVKEEHPRISHTTINHLTNRYTKKNNLKWLTDLTHSC